MQMLHVVDAVINMPFALSFLSPSLSLFHFFSLSPLNFSLISSWNIFSLYCIFLFPLFSLSLHYHFFSLSFIPLAKRDDEKRVGERIHSFSFDSKVRSSLSSPLSHSLNLFSFQYLSGSLSHSTLSNSLSYI